VSKDNGFPELFTLFAVSGSVRRLFLDHVTTLFQLQRLYSIKLNGKMPINCG